MIKLENVHKSYGSTKVLNGITLEIKSGEFISLMGSSGSGKSTLLNLVGAMDLPDSGSITVRGENIVTYNDEQLTLYRRNKIGFIFQFFNLFQNLPVFENIRIPLLLQSIREDGRVREYINLVGLAGREKDYPYQLSGGQQQRVAIARALIHNPDIILADEPTGSLDSSNSRSIMELITRLAEEMNKTVILVTHESAVARYAHRLERISDGVLLQ
ncbi:MAG: ABC transporter ATP-binding protein [Nitrospirae bacterium]|nr:ABC transporter ATP-binding protein [Nitrospirota bacterium]